MIFITIVTIIAGIMIMARIMVNHSFHSLVPDIYIAPLPKKPTKGANEVIILILL